VSLYQIVNHEDFPHFSASDIEVMKQMVDWYIEE
jgi:hypothetical protein